MNESCNKNTEIINISHNEAHNTLTSESLIQPAEISSINITDKLFEKFCLISNDEIMRYSSNFSDIRTDSLEASIFPHSTSTGGYEQLVSLTQNIFYFLKPYSNTPIYSTMKPQLLRIKSTQNY